MSTPKQQLLELRYRGDLAADIAHLADGGMSWRDIARRISEHTGMQVSHESLRAWYGSKAGAA